MAKDIKQFLYHNRFELFLATLCFNLFGSLVFNDEFFNNVLFPIGFSLNIVAGINLIKQKHLKLLFTVLFALSLLIFGASMFMLDQIQLNYFRFLFYFIFYAIITFEIIKQIWTTKSVNKNVIIGVMSGYISLGLIAYFICMTIEMATPGSFNGLVNSDSIVNKSDDLLYYSYITLMSIGYGEIYPLTAVGQKAAMLIGLMGQFYMVIITAVVVGKFLNSKD